MRFRRPRHAPSFFWQGCLIVLPVLGLAAVGLFSLLQDRRLATQDAQVRAQEALQHLVPEFRHRVTAELDQYLAWAQSWASSRAFGPPGDTNSAPILLRADGQPGASSGRADWATIYPDLAPEEVLFPPALVSASGEALTPRLWAAHLAPPDWFRSLTAEQQLGWQSAQALDATDTPRSDRLEAWQNVLQATDRPEARANAELALLRLEATSEPLPEAVERLCRFAHEHAHDRTESGLPVPAVSLGLALRLTATNALARSIVDALGQQLSSAPSLLSVHFIDECERRAASAPEEVQRAVGALRPAWRQQERFRELLTAWREGVDLAGEIRTSLWLNALSGRWFALLNSDVRPEDRAVGEPSASVTNRVTAIAFLPKRALQRMVSATLRDTTRAWPADLQVAAELEGERLTPFDSSSPELRGAAPLAHVSGSLQPRGPEPGPGRALASLTPPTPATAASPPQLTFTLAVQLADPAAFYARQNQRLLWFGTLILVAAATAVIGFIRARRAFWREHQLSEMKTNFVSSVSHELRAPIASVRLMAESLERGRISDPGRQGEYFRLIVQECRRLSALVANVLDYSRIEQGRKEYELEPVNLVDLVRATIQLMAPHAAEREIVIKDEIREPEIAQVQPPMLDGRAVQQALVNLIDNAFKHTPRNAPITVGLNYTAEPSPHPSPVGRERVPEGRVRAPSGIWRVWVHDQGPGIPLSEQERIFERFYRLGTELRRETQGVGIGLSIVKHIVEAHQGRIRVESTSGQGSRFTMEFPAP